MSHINAIYKREFKSYFSTPVAYVFIVIFLMLTGTFTFYFGQFYERSQADLQPFFNFHPWLYLFLIPAISMRLWAEERRSGSIELLLTLPITVWDSVLGKFLASWSFVALAMVFTFPIWITVNYLGNPDNGVIIATYIGSLLMAGGFLAIGSCISAITKNQVIAFIISVVICFGFLFSGFPMVLSLFSSWLPSFLVDTIASFSFFNHFQSISKGVMDIRDIFYFLSVIFCWLYANVMIIDMKKAD